MKVELDTYLDGAIYQTLLQLDSMKNKIPQLLWMRPQCVAVGRDSKESDLAYETDFRPFNARGAPPPRYVLKCAQRLSIPRCYQCLGRGNYRSTLARLRCRAWAPGCHPVARPDHFRCVLALLGC